MRYQPVPAHSDVAFAESDVLALTTSQTEEVLVASVAGEFGACDVWFRGPNDWHVAGAGVVARLYARQASARVMIAQVNLTDVLHTEDSTNASSAWVFSARGIDAQGFEVSCQRGAGGASLSGGQFFLRAKAAGGEAAVLGEGGTARPSAMTVSNVVQVQPTGPVTVTQAEPSLLQATVVQSTAGALKATVVQTDAAALQATVVQTNPTSLQATVVQSDPSALLVTVAQSNAAALKATVVQSDPTGLQATVSQSNAAALKATVVQSTASALQATVSQSDPTILQATVVQSRASSLQATVVQSDATALQATIVQPEASALQATVAQSNAAALKATVVQSTPSALQATVSQSDPTALQATVAQSNAAALKATVVQSTAAALQATVVQSDPTILQATVVQSREDSLHTTVYQPDASSLQATVAQSSAASLQSTAAQGAAAAAANRWPVYLSDGSAALGTASSPLYTGRVRDGAATFAAATGLLGTGTSVALKSLAYLWHPSSSTKRVEIRRIVVSYLAGAGTGPVLFRIVRITGVSGTPGGSALTPSALDSADSSGLTVLASATGAPTRPGSSQGDVLAIAAAATANDTFQWDAADYGKPLVLRASTAEGIEVLADVKGALTSQMQATVSFEWVEV